MATVKGFSGSVFIGNKKIADMRNWEIQYTVPKATHRDRLFMLLPYRVRRAIRMCILPLLRQALSAVYRP
jgi:hypothetical protein